MRLSCRSSIEERPVAAGVSFRSRSVDGDAPELRALRRVNEDKLAFVRVRRCVGRFCR
jgi:hypothetical protein